MRIKIHARPRSAKNKIEKISDTEYKIWLTESPVGGKANGMLIRVLAEYFDVPKSSLNIASGKTAKKKIIEILQ